MDEKFGRPVPAPSSRTLIHDASDVGVSDEYKEIGSMLTRCDDHSVLGQRVLKPLASSLVDRFGRDKPLDATRELIAMLFSGGFIRAYRAQQECKATGLPSTGRAVNASVQSQPQLEYASSCHY